MRLDIAAFSFMQTPSQLSQATMPSRLIVAMMLSFTNQYSFLLNNSEPQK